MNLSIYLWAEIKGDNMGQQKFSTKEIEEALTPQLFGMGRLLGIAFSTYPIIMLIIIFVMKHNLRGTPNTAASLDLMTMIEPIFLIFALSIYGICLIPTELLINSKIGKKLIFQRMYRNTGRTETAPIVRAIAFDRVIMIFRASFIQQVPILGFVPSLIRLQAGDFSTIAVLFKIALPGFIGALYIFKNYILKDDYVERLENVILPAVAEY